MHPSQVSAQDMESARAVVVLIIAGVIVFWRFALRAMVAIMAVTVGLGLFVLMHDIHG
jgi:hypothetical protein